MGVWVFVILDYYDYYYLSFEAKLDGGVGYNIQLSIDNPTISGSQTITLLGASTATTSFPLGFGLSLATNFGGLQAVLSGSGSATGSASMGAGANANAYFGVEYDYLETPAAYGNGWKFPTDAEFSYTAPFLSYTDFTPDSISIGVELTGTQDFSLGYHWLGVDWLGADFTVSVTGDAEYAYSTSAAMMSEMSVSVGSPVPSNTVSATVGGHPNQPTRRLSDTMSASVDLNLQDLPVASIVQPGDVLPISVAYSGFNTGEKADMFFSLHRDDF